MLVFPTYQKLVTSKGLPDTVALAGSSGYWSYATNSTSVNSDFTLSLSNVPTVPRAGKRVVLIHFSYRLTGSDAYDAYNTWFKPSGQSGSATITLGGVTPTFYTWGRTLYNGTGIYIMRTNLNTSGSNASVSFDFDNTSFDTSGLSDFTAPGGYGFTIWIFDYVEDYWVSAHGYNSNSSSSGQSGLNDAPPGSGSGFTASHKAITGHSSNSNALNWDPSDSSTYTTTLDTDIGTNERIETSYSFETTASPSNLSGDMDVSSGSASGGVSTALSFLRFKPSTS
jgi:hypothetical protein